MRVVGLDLSLTSSGVAPSDGSTYRIKTNAKQTLPDRLRTIADRVCFEISNNTLTLIEEVPSHAAFSITALAKVHGAVLYKIGNSPMLYATPPVLKKYATGKGNANKDAVLAEAIRRFNFQGTSNDEADAFILMNMGMDLLGTPLVAVPQTHKDKGYRDLEKSVAEMRAGGVL